ncbi:MAG: DivIVA domain-containing protein [Acidimicrobiia bacterium]
MDVSPQTIRQVEFREKLRGYHQDDVDEFLERVAAGLEILQERLRQATERAVRAEQAAGDRREDDESLRRTLVLAQRTADLAIKEAREQAARLMEEAEKEAAAITADAEAEARRLTDEAQVQARKEVEQLEAARGQLRDEVDRLVRYLDEQRARAKAVLTEAARDLDQALTAPAPPASTTAAGGPGGRRTSPAGPGERGTLGFAGMHPRAGGPGPRDARPGP